jgi:hypothetical protein
MILLRRHRFWSRSAATVTCDHEDCAKAGPADLVLAPSGGFALKWNSKVWHALMDSKNPGAPFRTFCAEHRPVIERASGPLPSRNAAAEAKRLIDVVRR